MNLGTLEITFCGHATFAMKSPGGKHIMIDPFLEQNPMCPPELKLPKALDTIFVTHGHLDHIAEAAPLAKRFKCTCVAIPETAAWLAKQGVEKTIDMNKGGTVDVGGVKATMTHAVHSCGIRDGDNYRIYGGEAAGYVLTFENGIRVYHAGDTMVFSDMKIIADLYNPDIVMLPIGDHYTMDPLQAAYAVRMMGAKVVVPMHYATFPVLTGTPERLRELTADIAGLRIIALKPGQTLTGELEVR
jgi:L-ascorbate metabolism protein UlaG (beta-lactamase superfamily)